MQLDGTDRCLAAPPGHVFTVLPVIGSGPAGQKGAIAAAKLGKSVAMVDEKAMIGGVSLHGSTIPSKTLREAILYLSGIRERSFYGRDYAVKEDIKGDDLVSRVRIVEESEMQVIRDQLHRNGVRMVFGWAHFVDQRTVSVVNGEETETLSGEYFLIACGTRPARDPDIPFDGRSVIDVSEILDLLELPRELIVVGAGVIGLEYASMFAALDIEVTIIERESTLLKFVDREIIERLVYHLRNLNAVFRLGESVVGVKRDKRNRVAAVLESGKRVRGDVLLYAIGRQTNSDTLNLNAVGLTADKLGRLTVNEKYQTEAANISAAGDVIGFPALAATSMEQGRLAVSYHVSIRLAGID